MKILVEIDLKDIEPNDIYKPNSGWFNIPGYINISLSNLDIDWNTDEALFKYIGQVHEEQPRP